MERVVCSPVLHCEMVVTVGGGAVLVMVTVWAPHGEAAAKIAMLETMIALENIILRRGMEGGLVRTEVFNELQKSIQKIKGLLYHERGCTHVKNMECALPFLEQIVSCNYKVSRSRKHTHRE